MKNFSVKKTFCYLLLLGVFAISGYIYDKESSTKVVEMHAVYPEYDIQSLEKEADLIIVANPTKDFNENTATIHYEDNNSGKIDYYYTAVKLKVNGVLKGEYSKKEIDVLEPAAVIDTPVGIENILLITEDYTTLNKNKKYLLFLKKNDLDSYSIIGGIQGKYNIDGLDAKEKTIDNDHYKKLKKQVLEQYKNDLE